MKRKDITISTEDRLNFVKHVIAKLKDIDTTSLFQEKADKYKDYIKRLYIYREYRELLHAMLKNGWTHTDLIEAIEANSKKEWQVGRFRPEKSIK